MLLKDVRWGPPSPSGIRSARIWHIEADGKWALYSNPHGRPRYSLYLDHLPLGTDTAPNAPIYCADEFELACILAMFELREARLT